MYQLELLGQVSLRDAGGRELRSVLSQPKRFAMLLYLAMRSTKGACRRDGLLLLFWPNLTLHRARNALNKAVHFLRQALGEDAILSRGADELWVDCSRISCDAIRFGEAIERGDLAEALELYRGELAPSFHIEIEDGLEFERWLESERIRLRRTASHAALLLAQQRELEGQISEAVRLARLAVETDDDDERSVRELLELLDRLGDRAGALYAYDKFARRLQTEFESQPAAETRLLIERIRARVQPRSDSVLQDAIPAVSAHHSLKTTVEAATSNRMDQRRPKRVWHWGVVPALATALVAAAVWPSAAPRFVPTRVLVLPLDNHTADSALTYTVAQLLATLPDAIAREGVGEPVPTADVTNLARNAPSDPSKRADWLARKAGAGLLLRGACSRVGTATVCQTDLLRMPDRALRFSVSVTGDVNDKDFVAELRERLLVALFLQRTWGDHPRWKGEYLPRSLAAIRAFKQGCCDGVVERRYYGQAALLDTAWAGAAALAAYDSSETVAESTYARLMRRPELLEGERETVALMSMDYRLHRSSKPFDLERHNSNALFALLKRRFAVNPEWWLGKTLYWGFFTARPNTVLDLARYADSAHAPGVDRPRQPWALQSAALHHLGRNRDLLKHADIMDQLELESRTARVMALAGLGDVHSLKQLLRAWEATPETGAGLAGTRSYVAGLELIAHGRKNEGLEILASTIPLYRRMRAAEGYTQALWEVLLLTGLLGEARKIANEDLPRAKTLADSLYIYGILGAIATREQKPAEAAQHFGTAMRLYDRVARLPQRPMGAMAYVKALMGDQEGAVRLLEEGRTHGRGFAEFRLAHRAPAFLGLYGYPPFEHFLKPRD